MPVSMNAGQDALLHLLGRPNLREGERFLQGMEFSRNGCRNAYCHDFETVVCYTADVQGTL